MPSSPTLLEDSIPFSPTLASVYGVCGALIMQQVHYWCQINKKNGVPPVAGHTWMFKPVSEWEMQLQCFSKSTVKRSFASLLNSRALVSGRFNKNKYDKTAWYRIDYTEVQSRLLGVFTEKTKSVKLAPSMVSNWSYRWCHDGPIDGVNLALTIQDNNEDNNEDKKPENHQPLSSKFQPEAVTVIPKNSIRKGPTDSGAAAKALLVPPSERTASLLFALYKVWASEIPVHYPDVKFIPPFNTTQSSQMKQIWVLWSGKGKNPEEAVTVLRTVISSWGRFVSYVKENAGIYSTPAVPSLAFLTKHKILAMNFFLSANRPKDSSVGKNAVVCTSPPGKITIVKIGKPNDQKPVPAVSPEVDEDDQPLTLDFLLGFQVPNV